MVKTICNAWRFMFGQRTKVPDGLEVLSNAVDKLERIKNGERLVRLTAQEASVIYMNIRMLIRN
jgi:hypothetical protein